ncbi:MAG: hypothetical protein MJ153_05790 [Clostridia bacterium]|nr:hypothetical protein [Clostridia bacterium]
MNRRVSIVLFVALCLMAGCSNGESITTSDTATIENITSETTMETMLTEKENAETSLIVTTTEAVETTINEEVTEPYVLIIGNCEETKYVTLFNSTSKDIVAVTVRLGSDGSFSDNLLLNGNVFAAGEECEFHYEYTEGQYYSINITFADGSEDRLHRFVFENSDFYTIKIEGETMFVQYFDGNGNEITTRDNEYAVDHPSSSSSGNPDSGCIGDDGLFY